MGASGTDNFCLRWNDFAENVSGAFKELRSESDFFDVTLACTDSGSKTLQAHKVILSACSNFFKSTFREQSNANKHPNPYIYLRGVTFNDLNSILDFIYNGEVNVAQEDLNSFLAVAEELQIKGLTNRDSNSTSNNSSVDHQSASNSSKKSLTPSQMAPRPRSAAQEQPPVKKIRKSSPAPSMVSSTPSKPAVMPIEIEPEEVKEVVNIKDDPEVLAHASTSAVNVPEHHESGQDFGGDEYDESYDGYYEDDGAEMGDGAEGTDGTKVAGGGGRGQTNGNPRIDEHLLRFPDGRVQCIDCNSFFKSVKTGKQHVETTHKPQYHYQCLVCKDVIRGKLYFVQHVGRKHFRGGANIAQNYGRIVADPESGY